MPRGTVGAITDLRYDKSTDTIRWSYANVGDYDLNGQVGVPDIVPIAQLNGAIVGDGIGQDTYEEWIDRSGE